MAPVLSVILFSTGAFFLAWMLVQAYRGKHDLICVRNLFMLGIIEFQFVSGGLTMWTLQYPDFFVNNPVSTGAKFYILLMIFVGIYLWSYSRGWGVRKWAQRSAYPFPDQKPATLLMIAALFLGFGFIFRVVIGRNVPILGILTDVMAIGLLAGAAGLASWAWAPRLFNLAIALPAIAIIFGAVGSTVFQTFGRRDVLSVMLTVLFAAYHSHWKYQGWLRLSYRLGGILTIGIFFLAAFSTVRAATYKQTDVSDIIYRLSEADVSGGLASMAEGQNAAGNSMWLIENRPPFEPFHSVLYTLSNPIPRAIWENKPYALGYNMVREASQFRSDPNYTVGAGLIGHIYNDNPWLTLIPYAIFFGLLWRFFDEHVTVHPSNPFVVLPVIVGSGDLLGIPRGEVGLFLFRALTAMFTAWIAMRFCIGVLRTFGGIPRPGAGPREESFDQTWDQGEIDQYDIPSEQPQDSGV